MSTAERFTIDRIDQRDHVGLPKTNIPTDILRTFVAVQESGSFTKVARSLHLTQPAISAQIRRLETMVGDTLISRNGSGFSLTARGNEILASARRILMINDQILLGRSLTRPTIRVGVPSSLAAPVVTALYDSKGTQKRNARVQVLCDYSPVLHRGVRDGYLELACVIGEDVDPTRTLGSWIENFVWVRSPGARFNITEVIPIICSPNRILPDRLAIDAMQRSGLRFEVVFSSSDRTTREFAAMRGLGYLACPERRIPSGTILEQTSMLPALGEANVSLVIRDGLDPIDISSVADTITTALYPSTAGKSE